jgi:hypothetical protein
MLHAMPRHRMPFNSRNEGSNCVSMMGRAMWAWQILRATS